MLTHTQKKVFQIVTLKAGRQGPVHRCFAAWLPEYISGYITK